MAKKRVLVWGAGGHGKVIVDALLQTADCEVGGIIDEDIAKNGTELLGVKVALLADGLPETVYRLRCDAVAIAIGDNYTRYEKLLQVRRAGFDPVNVIHPSAQISRFVQLGQGVTILAGAIINAGSVIEDNVCVNTAASVDHDNFLENSCHIFPKAALAGGVRIREFSYVGSGAVITPNRTVQKYSYVGAGAVVLQDVPEGAVVCGVPAKMLKQQPRRPGLQP